MQVLQPVQRRRRRRRRFRPILLLALVAAASAVAAAAVAHEPHRERATSTKARAVTRAVARPRVRATPRPHRTEPLLYGTPVSHTPLALRAGAAIVVDAATGRVLWSRRPHRRLPIASTTKIMTAVLVLRDLPLQSVVTVDRSVPRVPLVKDGLRAGERAPAWKLLYGMLLYSGNDDALALALAVGKTRPHFVALMNEEARRLGLHDTHYAGPSGVVDLGNYSSAWDLAALTRFALRDSRFRRVVRTRIERVTWPAPTYSKVYVNKNRLLTLYRGAIGVKTGWTTKAGHCLVAAATRNGRTLIAVVIRSSDEYADAKRLLDRGFAVRAPS